MDFHTLRCNIYADMSYLQRVLNCGLAGMISVTNGLFARPVARLLAARGCML
jgi:hypothetical protein